MKSIYRFVSRRYLLNPSEKLLAVWLAAVTLISATAQAQDLFVTDGSAGSVYSYTPAGAQSLVASGMVEPFQLAFDNAGDLFEADAGSGNIYEFAPDGTQSTFASGLEFPRGLAFQGESLPVPEPAVLGLSAIGLAALLVRGRRKRG